MVDAHGDSGDFVGLAEELKELYEVALALFKVPDGAVHLLYGRIEHAADLRILHCELVAVGIHQFIDDFLQVFGQSDFFEEIVERRDVVGDCRFLFKCVLELDEGAEAAHAIFVDGLEAVGVVTAEFVAVAVRMTGPAGRFIRLPAASVNEPRAGVSLQRIAFLGREIDMPLLIYCSTCSVRMPRVALSSAANTASIMGFFAISSFWLSR